MYVVRLRHSVPQALQISRSSASTEWNSVALHGRHNARSAGRGNSVGPRRCCILVAPQCSSISQCENATARNGPTEQCVCRGGARRRLAGVHRAPHSPLIPDRTASARLEFVGAVGRRSIGILYCLFPAALVEDALPRTHHNPQRINSVSGLPRQRKSIAVGARHGASAGSLTSTVTVRYRAFGARFGSGIDRSTRSTPLHTPTDS